MSVHYKFKSGKEAHTITFDSLHISVGELKKSIMQQRKIGKSADLDLQITNAQTKEVYDSDGILIPKNTSVIVARVPVANSKKSWNKNDNKSNDNFSVAEEKTSKGNLTDGTEDDKIKEMLTQSTKDYDPSKYARGKGPLGPLPANYTCYRCGKPGHYIKHCPTNNIDVKRSTGIPRSFMIPAKADQKGAMITASGEYAVPIIDHDAYREIKKEKPPFFSTESEPEMPKIDIPDDLKCPLCNNLLQDAVMVPCCGNSFCDECIRLLLLDSDNHECPSCKETNISPETLIPNRFLRIAVTKFKNENSFGTRQVEEKKSDVPKSPDQAQGATEDGPSDETELQVPQPADTNEAASEHEDQSNESDSKFDQKGSNQGTEDIDLDEAFHKEEKVNELSNTEPGDVKTDKENSITKRENESNPASGSVNGTNESSSNSTQPSAINPIHTLQPPYTLSLNNNASGRYRPNQSHARIRQSGQPNMYPRVPGALIMPRNNFSQNRTLLPHEPTFYGDHMQPFPQMGMPIPYGYGSQIRGQMFDNMYNMNSRGSQMNPLLPYANNMNLAALGGHPIMDQDGAFYPPYKYDDYEDKLERFNRQLEARSRKHPRRYSRSRSRSGRSRSRSKSYSSTSSRSSSRSRRTRRRSPNRHGGGRRERSRSSHRHPNHPNHSKPSFGHNRRPDLKYDKRNDRPSERSEKDYEKKYKPSRRDKEREPNKETIDVARKSFEKHVDNNIVNITAKEEKGRNQNQEEERIKAEENETNHSSDTNANIDESTKDFNLDKVDAPQTVDNSGVKGNESPKPLCEPDNAYEKAKPATRNETKVESSQDPKDKPRDRDSSKHSKNKRNRSCSRSVSQNDSSECLSDHGVSRSKKKSKKSSRDSKHKNTERHRGSSKHESKPSEHPKSSNKDGPFQDNPSRDAQEPVSTEPKDSSMVDLSENLEPPNKTDEMEIKIQEDYSDLENEELARLSKGRRDSTRESKSNHNNKENVSKPLSSRDHKPKEDKTGEESHRRVKISTSKLTEKPLLSVTIENKAKIDSKISIKDKEGAKEKERDKRRDKDKKSDKSRDRGKERSKDGKSKDKHHRDRDRDHSSRKEHKSESGSSKSKSKDKKRDKERAKEKDDRSKRSSRRSRSRSGSVSGRKKKIKSEIDTSSSKHKSSKSHRK